MKIIWRIFVFSFLTVLTQIGGLVYLLTVLSYKWMNKKIPGSVPRSIGNLCVFLILYFFTTLIIVPVIAKPFGRVTLPISETNHLQPLNILTCLLNRNYVRPELKQVAFEVASQVSKDYPGTKVNYLDANFPFIDGFPLFPHLSHNDGRKLDLSFCYRDRKSNTSTNDCPSFIGYGICEEPMENEQNTADLCSGHWQYSFLKKIVPQANKNNFIFDGQKTKTLVNCFVKKEQIGKIFIEPHLKIRLQLNSDKVRFHGCQAVRHDDHIHVELK